jgi:iron-sulfur cluster repair protein YtfE (RIC family)
MSSPTTGTLASDPWEMALIHRLIRRGFEQGREFVAAPGATARAGAVAEYVGFHLDGLEAHHSSEDELLWPTLHERASLSDALIRRMEEQHAGLHDAIETTRRELDAWVVTPSETGSESLASAIDTLAERLAEHLAEEERDIVPLIATHVTQAEWDHLGKVAFSKFTPKQQFTAMGEMLAAATPTEAARMLAGLPAPIKLVWRLFGRRKYKRSIAKARG